MWGGRPQAPEPHRVVGGGHDILPPLQAKQRHRHDAGGVCEPGYRVILVLVAVLEQEEQGCNSAALGTARCSSCRQLASAGVKAEIIAINRDAVHNCLIATRLGSSYSKMKSTKRQSHRRQHQ